MIKIENISKAYGTKKNPIQVIHDVSFTIMDGNFIVILGASGSGKSTLLNLISGLEKPDKGHIYYNEKDIIELNDKELTLFRKENIGFVFQQYFLLQNMNVLKNIKMGADLVSNKNIDNIIQSLGLSDKQKKYPYELSGGEQQRVSIARALSKQPKFLFLDEPTGALDEKTSRQVLDFICHLQEKLKFTMIMVTHNQNIAEMAHEVIKINSGQIESIQKNSHLKTAYEIRW